MSFMSSLDCFQAGLSWLTILKKRGGFRKAFDGFLIDKVAQYDESRIAILLADSGIIRNKQKINAVINNARQIQKIKEEFGSFDRYIWQFTNYKSIINRWSTIKEIPATSLVSDKMSADMKKRNLKFVGSTICYAFMQSIGMVNDHTLNCFRYNEVNELVKKAKP